MKPKHGEVIYLLANIDKTNPNSFIDSEDSIFIYKARKSNKYYSSASKAICQAFLTFFIISWLTTPNFFSKRISLSQVKGESHKILLGWSKPFSKVFSIKTSTGNILSKSSVVS